jgi:hypothetical protein
VQAAGLRAGAERVSTERDTRAEMLRAGDRVRYMGEWLDIVKVTGGVDRPQGFEQPLAMIVLTCEDDHGAPRSVFYRPGVFVAADCMPRVDA